MKKIIEVQPSLFTNLFCDQKIIEEHRIKYNRISTVLDEQPAILNAVHQDLKQFGSDKGRGAKFSSEQVLRMLLVMVIEQCTYRQTIIRVAESDFLRNFTRIGMGKVMSFAFLCAAFKQISAQTWQRINGMVLLHAHERGKISSDKVRVDSTVCETTIHYPTDCSLLWDSYRVVARYIRECNEQNQAWNLGNRFHETKIKKLYTYIATHCTKKNKRTIQKCNTYMKTLIERVDTLCNSAQAYISNAHSVAGTQHQPGCLTKLQHFLDLGRKVVLQSTRAWINGETVPATQRIFSIFEEHTQLHQRGKAYKPREFGHLVTIAQTAEKFISFYDVREQTLHDSKMKDVVLDAHKVSFGKYPEQFTADKNYYQSMEDIEAWQQNIEIMAIGKKGRRNAQEYEREHSELFSQLQRFRAGVEGSISVLKRAFGLSRCRIKGFNGFAASIGCLVLCHNLVLLTRL
jgi:IS5 family transposase